MFSSICILRFLFLVLIQFSHSILFSFFFFTDTATTEIYTLSLHDALPISIDYRARCENKTDVAGKTGAISRKTGAAHDRDRKSTRLNSSHTVISYAVFCLKKKKKKKTKQ